MEAPRTKQADVDSASCQNWLGERPAAVQKAVDANFKAVQSTSWGSTGEKRDPSSSEPYFYNLMAIRDQILLLDLLESKAQNIYMMDVGAGYGAWGDSVLEFIKKHPEFKASGKKFHIISVTGGGEFQDFTGGITHDDYITVYRIPHFNIENIISELEKRGLQLKNSINLIMSNLTLQHLVDPVGTVKQLYDLLSPDNGKLVSSGFFFWMQKGGITQNNYYALWTPKETDSYMVFCRQSGNFYDFLVLKKNNKPFTAVLDYTGEIFNVERKDAFGKQTAIFKTSCQVKWQWKKDELEEIVYYRPIDQAQMDAIFATKWGAAMRLPSYYWTKKIE